MTKAEALELLKEKADKLNVDVEIDYGMGDPCLVLSCREGYTFDGDDHVNEMFYAYNKNDVTRAEIDHALENIETMETFASEDYHCILFTPSPSVFGLNGMTKKECDKKAESFNRRTYGDKEWMKSLKRIGPNKFQDKNKVIEVIDRMPWTEKAWNDFLVSYEN